ncbi:type II toxin-antitoxin system BrnA family antitoxin [Pseudanabaena sp. SR411]|uniref:type II toxin-antitoxin system BrnA family antitoxin n=1 Tax=Pseudanabaena sp. SR411 TaxID=1980935 RepID=UPI0020CCDAE1|nr:CopG family transcriptional regulator [Pseudanabaena sp. SR411]
MKAEELDKKFDDGEDVLDLFDLTTLKRPDLETQSVAINLPQWMIAALDRESVRLHVRRRPSIYNKVLVC